ncbi:MAG TPA: hypothetical protein VD816_02385 [Ohtaekwangia sp.]|nr:hypothetical protein [Ohtaekwangia sp.]
MQSFFFWRDWPKDLRWVWYGLAALFLFALIFLWFSYFMGTDQVIHWDTIQEQKAIETTVHRFQLGPFHLDIPADSHVIFEYFHGSRLVPNTTASYIFLIVMMVAAVVLVSVTTALERFWFFTGTALMIFFIVSLRLEVVGLFGMFNRIPLIVILVIYTALCFYFNRIGVSVSFVRRLLSFAFLTIAVGCCIQFFSAVDYPFYHLTLTGYTPALVLTVLFVIMVAHEIFASFVYVVSQGSTKSLRHLSIISAIYFANLLITCLHEIGVIEWEFVYINLYLLLTVSALIGIWGFRDREPLYGGIVPFQPLGAYFFLAMGAICFATTGQLLGNANDPAVRIVRDVIIFSHTGYGLIFLTYLFSNFILMLARNLPVYKVLYQPNRMPYFTYRFAGTIVMLAFVFVSNWKEYVYYGVAGFYNGTGDLYTLMDNENYAQSFYEQGRLRAYGNHRSNYAMATIKASQADFQNAHFYYDLANYRNPSVYAMVNNGNLFVWENQVFNAIAAYHRANTENPGLGPVQNNLGFAYTKIHNIDSALRYLGEARQHRISKAAAESNFFAMAAAETIPFQVDSVFRSFDSQAPAVAANAIALATLSGQPFTLPVDPLPGENLGLHTATLLGNYVIHHAKTVDTTLTNRAYAIARNPANTAFSEPLKAALSHAYYHQGNVTRALEILAELVYLSQNNKGKYNYIMGLWALEQRNPVLASSYFTYADTYAYKQARFYNAIALTEARRIEDALVAWDTVFNGDDEAEQNIASQMKKILQVSPTGALQLADREKYQYCRYNIGIRDSVFFDRLVNTFDNPNYKAQALLDVSRYYFESDHPVTAIRFYNRIAGLELTDSVLFNEIRHFELVMLAARGALSTLARQINKGITFDGSRRLEKMLYTALIASSSGDTVLAAKNFEVLGTYNPYFEEGILASVEFFRNQDPKSLKAYTLLAEAIHVNTNSIRLLKAYIGEATRIGFDEYASSAVARLNEIETGLR